MRNLLLDDIEYRVEKSRLGVWRRYLYPTGAYFAEFKSHRHFFGLPLVHYTRGICPETGKRIVAKGVVAVGRLATGILAIGHASFGVIAIGQLGLGVLVGVGQASTGLAALGQVAIGAFLGLGQLATGYVAIGQVGIGGYVLAQIGLGEHVWSQRHADIEAVEFFRSLAARLSQWH
ncbi:MAG: hypothetical protein SWH78_02340 [Thermodesulfobacteriota bacterium]|nr:hypothetical protein [Thermodesulfobacteriota bacterium]